LLSKYLFNLTLSIHPNSNPDPNPDPFLSPSAEQYGPIKTIKMVVDKEDKPRGFAFIEFEREEDMTSAYKKVS
jgi:RNA recognition motif-containing protein